MKKFSNITKQEVNQEPKIDSKVNEQDVFKHQVLKLMDDFLKVQLYGPITRYHVAGSMKVAGKEIFLEALMSLLKQRLVDDKVKLLESLKYEIKDWSVLDSLKDEILIESVLDEKTLRQRERIKSLYNLYKDDKDLLIAQFEKASNKIKNGNLAYLRASVAKEMAEEGEFSSEVMEEVSNIFFKKAEELGYSKKS